jgi:class 3 adenylate cyclase
VRFLTYWFDQDRGTTFCLVDAPDKETAQTVHRQAHGFVAEEIVEVSLSAVEAFLGRITDPTPPAGRAESDMDAGHRTIMFTDIVGSTEMTARLGDSAATELVRAHDALVRRALDQNHGREVKHLGDGIMAVFGAAQAAIACAKDIQLSFKHYNRGTSEPIHIRIGLDVGEPVEDSRDLFGSTVQCASRMCDAASADEILVSKAVRKECSGHSAFTDRGHMHLKGFREPVAVFAYRWRNEMTGATRTPLE